MSLESLIKGCLAQNRKDQKALYMAYKDALYTIVYRITGDNKHSEDLLQDTFIEAFRKMATLKEPKFFYSWIKTILIRKTYAFLKTEKKFQTVSETEDYLGDANEVYDISYIEHAILKLPYKCRTVFVMVEIEGFSHQEIAAEMNISVGTSKSQLNYAKTKLKNMLSPILKD